MSANLIDELIAREGDFVDHPADRGGPTRYGITEQVARAHGYTGDMRALPRDTAAAIYREQYWTTPHFDAIDAIEPTIAAELFDGGVNMGTARASMWLQRALNLLNRGASDYPDMGVDGQLGAVSRAALQSYRRARPGAEGLAVLLWMIRAFRTGRYAEIAEANPSQEVFEYGWIARQVRGST